MSEHEHQCECGHHHYESQEHDCACGNEHQCCGGCNHQHDEHSCSCGHQHDTNHNHGLTINFDGVIQSDLNNVWNILTENDSVGKWFPGLSMSDFRSGGSMSYQSNGETTSFMILDIEAPTLFTFAWFGGTVAIELCAEDKRSTLINFSHWIEYVNEDTAVQLSRWLIALQTIAAMSENKEIESHEEQFTEIYPRMLEMLALQDNETIEFE